MSVAWNEFSWEAFATLTTGLGAVAAAAWVGLRQTSISNQQTKILDRQTQLAELTLKQELFDRRAKIYNSVQDFIAYEVTNDPVGHTVPQDYYLAVNTARFLFSPEVTTRLSEVSDKIEQRRALRKKIANMPQGDTRKPLTEEFVQLDEWLRNRLDTLDELFQEMAMF